MNTRFFHLFYGLSVLFCISCTRLPQNATKPNFTGVIYEQKWNNMPQIDNPNSKGAALSTTLYIFEPTNLNQIENNGNPGPYITQIHSKLLDSVQSDKNGTYSIHLTPGKYSVFVRYQNAYYVPFFSGKEGVAHIEIKPNENTHLDIVVKAGNSVE